MEGSPVVSALMVRPPEAFEAWEAFDTRPVSAGSSIPGIDGLPSRSLRRPRSSTRLQAEVEMNRAQAQLSEMRTKLSAESREVDRLQQCLDAADGEASHQRSLAQAAQLEVAKLHQQLAASEEAHRSYAEAAHAAQAVQDAAGRAATDSERRLQAQLAELSFRLRQAESGRESIHGDQMEQKQRLEEKAAYATTRAAEQGELAARAERRLRETEEKFRSLQAAYASLSSSASAEIETAATRVRDLEVELERWQGWAEEEVASAQRDSATQLSVEQRRVAELGQELPRVRERLAEAEAQLRAKEWDIERMKTEAATKAADVAQQMDSMQREQERQMAHYKATVDAELQNASSHAVELESKLSVREQELERQLAAAWAKAAEREAQLETADQQLRASRAREKQLESRLAELNKDMPRAQLRLADLESQLQATTQQRSAMQQRANELELLSESKQRELDRQVSQYRAMLSAEVQSSSARAADLEAKFGVREQELSRQLQDALAKIADLEAQREGSSRLAQQCTVLSTDLQAARRHALHLEAQLKDTQRSAEVKRSEELRHAAKAAELEAQFEHRLAEEKRIAAEQAAQLRSQCAETAELSSLLATARGELEKLRPAFEEELSAEKAKTLKLEAALQARLAKQADVAGKEVQTVQLNSDQMQEAQAMLQALEVQVYDLTQKLEVQTWATVDAETRAEAECNQLQASETRCADLWRQNSALQLTVEKIVERERSTASSLEAQITALKEQLRLGRADALEEVERTSSRICTLHGQVAKSSHEAAELEKRLKDECDKARQRAQEVSQLQLQLRLETAKAERCTKESVDLQQQLQQLAESNKDANPELLQKEKEKVAELEQQLQQEKVQVAELGQQLQQEKAQVAELGQQLQQEKAQVAELGQQLQQEKVEAPELQENLQQRPSKVSDNSAEIQKEKEKAAELERQLQEEKDKVEVLRRQIKEQSSQAGDPKLDQQERAEAHGATEGSPARPVPEQASGQARGANAFEPCSRSSTDLGISLDYLCTNLLKDFGLPAASSLQDVETEIRRKTEAAKQQDGELDTPFVKFLEGTQSVGSATHYLCCASMTLLSDLVDTLKSYSEEWNLPMDTTFVWLRNFSGSLQPAADTAPQANRMRRIGRVWLLMSPCNIASFTGCRSCLSQLEMALSLQAEGLELTLLASPEEVKKLGARILEGDFTLQWHNWTVTNLEHALQRHLQCWVATLAEGWLRREVLEGSLAQDPARVGAACDAVGWLLREVSLHSRAESLLQDGLQLSLNSDQSAILNSPGVGPARRCRAELLMSYEEARRAHEQKGTLETASGVQLLESIGAARWIAGDAAGAAEALQQALRIRRANRSIESADGAMLLRNLGVVHRMCVDADDGLEELFLEARRVRERTGSFFGVDSAVLLLNLAFARADRGDSKGALEVFEEATTLLGAGAACSSECHGDEALPEPLQNAPCGASLLSAIGVARGNCEDQAGALSAYNHAVLIRQRTKTLVTPAGAVLRRNQGVALMAVGDAKASLDALLESKAIREQTGSLVSPAGANLLGSLAWSRAQCGDIYAAMGDCLDARQLHERAGTLRTPGGRGVLEKLKSLERMASASVGRSNVEK